MEKKSIGLGLKVTITEKRMIEDVQRFNGYQDFSEMTVNLYKQAHAKITKPSDRATHLDQSNPAPHP